MSGSHLQRPTVSAPMADERKLRVLVVASTFPAYDGDGTPSYVRDLAIRHAAEFDVRVLVPEVPASERGDFAPLDVRRFRYFPRRWEDLADGAIIENLRHRPSRWLQVPTFFAAEALALRREIRAFRPDIVHVHWLIPQGVTMLVVGRRVPMVVTTLGGDLYALNDAASTRLKAAVARRARAITAMNEDMIDRLAALGARREAMTVISMGAALDYMSEASKEVEQIPGRIAYVGRLAAKKGVPVLLGAVRKLPPGLDWSLDIVGDGPDRAHCEELAAGLPVVFHGQMGKADVAKVIRSASVVAVPSVRAASGDQDGLPVAQMEAMGLGRATVVSDLPGLTDAVRDGVEGLVVPPGDVDALAAALERLLRDDAQRSEMEEAAAVRGGLYDIEHIAQRYAAVLRQAASGAPFVGTR
jgi:glycosyltransferase involved in cell wall biosynthesis